MRILVGLIWIAFGLVGWVGQCISAINFPLAQKCGLQEKDGDTDSLYRIAEKNAATWDAAMIWTLVVAGILLILNHPSWPYMGLVAGGIYLDTGGRELAKYISLRKGGVKVGSVSEQKRAFVFLGIMSVIGLLAIVASSLSLFSCC